MEIDDIELAIGTRDSLKRQEITKQITNERKKNQASDLMLKKKLENSRANHILNALTLQKQLQEVKFLYEESRKQWDLETERMKSSIQNAFSTLYQQNLKKIATLSSIQETLNFDVLVHLDSQTASKVRESMECLEELSTNRMLYETGQTEFHLSSEEGGLDDIFLHTLFTNRLRRILNGDASTERLASEAITQKKLNNLRGMIDRFIQDLRNKQPELIYEEAGNGARRRSRKNTSVRLNKSLSCDNSKDLTVIQYNCITSSSAIPHTDNSVIHMRGLSNTSLSFEKIGSYLDHNEVEFSLQSEDVHEESTNQELISASSYSAPIQNKIRINESIAVEKTCLAGYGESRRLNDTLEQRMYAECSEADSRLASPNESSKFLRKKNVFDSRKEAANPKSWKKLICPCLFK